MLHDSPIGLDDNVHAVIGDTDSDGIFHGVLLTNDEEVVVGAIHAHVFDWLLDDSIGIVECWKDGVDLLKVRVDEHLCLLWDVCFDDSSLLIIQPFKLI